LAAARLIASRSARIAILSEDYKVSGDESDRDDEDEQKDGTTLDGALAHGCFSFCIVSRAFWIEARY
jgi:hypothetical protein